jgi:hypothetical protein
MARLKMTPLRSLPEEAIPFTMANIIEPGKADVKRFMG